MRKKDIDKVQQMKRNTNKDGDENRIRGKMRIFSLNNWNLDVAGEAQG